MPLFSIEKARRIIQDHVTDTKSTLALGETYLWLNDMIALAKNQMAELEKKNKS